ncbi:MAG: S41 family peptidase [Anaerolineales bacterium]|nr:S41 family peptidase [Anaerolineales bacterium]
MPLRWYSYLVDEEEPVELSGIHGRSGEPLRLFTLATVSGQRRPETPVYVLVSPTTHSAAEALAYDLQALQRATIVGEPTRGGAHPDRFFVIADQFLLTVPIAQALNPITGTNWEGTGVIPDVQTTAEEALEVAHRLAQNES